MRYNARRSQGRRASVLAPRGMLSTVIVLAAIGLPLSAGSAEKSSASVRTAPADSWVILTGTVKSTEDSRFILAYDGGEVAVDMDDWDSYEEGGASLKGKRITVSGVVERSDRRRPLIEANSVYSDGIYRYANAADEEAGYFAYPIETLAQNSNLITARGVVKRVRANEFILGTRLDDIKVDVSGLRGNPFFDEKGKARVEEGDKVSVFGTFDRIEIFDPREIRARSIVVLRRDKRRAPE